MNAQHQTRKRQGRGRCGCRSRQRHGEGLVARESQREGIHGDLRRYPPTCARCHSSPPAGAAGSRGTYAQRSLPASTIGVPRLILVISPGGVLPPGTFTSGGGQVFSATSACAPTRAPWRHFGPCVQSSPGVCRPRFIIPGDTPSGSAAVRYFALLKTSFHFSAAESSACLAVFFPIRASCTSMVNSFRSSIA